MISAAYRFSFAALRCYSLLRTLLSEGSRVARWPQATDPLRLGLIALILTIRITRVPLSLWQVKEQSSCAP